ncbi:T-complex protein 1 subunit eta [Tanacetum coccineum]
MDVGGRNHKEERFHEAVEAKKASDAIYVARLLNATGIIVVPGFGFGQVGDESYDSYFAKRDGILQSLASRVKYFADRDIFCAGRLAEDDLHRVAATTGGLYQTLIGPTVLFTLNISTTNRFLGPVRFLRKSKLEMNGSTYSVDVLRGRRPLLFFEVELIRFRSDMQTSPAEIFVCDGDVCELRKSKSEGGSCVNLKKKQGSLWILAFCSTSGPKG